MRKLSVGGRTNDNVPRQTVARELLQVQLVQPNLPERRVFGVRYCTKQDLLSKLLQPIRGHDQEETRHTRPRNQQQPFQEQEEESKHGLKNKTKRKFEDNN
jgi:hypothetical protein